MAPNVNKAFERKLVNKLESEKGNSFLSLGSCVLHTVNNGFGKGMKEIKEYMGIEQFFYSMFSFSLNTQQQEERTIKAWKV